MAVKPYSQARLHGIAPSWDFPIFLGFYIVKSHSGTATISKIFPKLPNSFSFNITPQYIEYILLFIELNKKCGICGKRFFCVCKILYQCTKSLHYKVNVNNNVYY